MLNLSTLLNYYLVSQVINFNTRQEAHIIKMSKSKNNSSKKVVKPVVKPAVEEKDKKAPEAPVAASEKPEVAPAEVPTPEVKVEEPKPVPAPKKEKETPKEKDKPVVQPTPAPTPEPTPLIAEENDVVIAEVVDTTKKEDKPKPTILGSVGANLATIGDPKDRLDKNHQVDLMNMIYKEFIANPDTDNHVGKVAKQQFNVMALISMVQYNAQIAGDLQSLGIKCDMKMGPTIEKMAMELLGVKVTSLPSPDNPNQLMLQFENVPTEVTRTAILEKKIENKPVPEPDPKLDEKEKVEAIQNLFQKKGDGGMGLNMLTGIEWARKAYSISAEEKKSVIFADIIHKGMNSTLINCLRGMVLGKINAEHSILGAHALMKVWCPTLPDSEIAEITQVLTAYAVEKKVKDWNEKAGSTHQCDVVNEFTLMNREISSANAEKVLTAILENKPDTTVDYLDGVGKLTVHPSNIRKTLVAAYGDSANLLKDKIAEIAKYYVTPIMRLSAYADKSAYSQK